jgi:hypothetical protein
MQKPLGSSALLSGRFWWTSWQMTALRGFLRPIRLGAAIALVCALCLPLSQCTQGGNGQPPPPNQQLSTAAAPKPAQTAGSTSASQPTLLSRIFPQSNDKATVTYAIPIIVGKANWMSLCAVFGHAKATESVPLYAWWVGSGLLLAFTWPLLSVLAGGRPAESRFSWLYHLLELALCAGTAFMLIAVTFCDDWLYGAYIAAISIGLFACTSLIFLGYLLWRVYRKWWDKIRRSSDGGPVVVGPAPSA